MNDSHRALRSDFVARVAPGAFALVRRAGAVPDDDRHVAEMFVGEAYDLMADSWGVFLAPKRAEMAARAYALVQMGAAPERDYKRAHDAWRAASAQAQNSDVLSAPTAFPTDEEITDLAADFAGELEGVQTEPGA